MSTDLTIDLKNRPSFLPAPVDSTAVASEFMTGLGGGGLSLPVLSMRGKVFRLRRDGQEVSLKAGSTLNVILVGSRPSQSRRFYAGAYVSGEISAPTCASADGIKPDADVEAPQADTCAACPNNAWGSKITASGAKGKKCDDYRRVLVFLPDYDILEPVVLDIPATSLRKRKGEQNSPQLFLKEYMQALGRNGLEPTHVVTTIGFTEDEYPRIAFSFERWVTAEEYTAVTECRESDEFDAALHHHEAPGTVEEKPVSMPMSKKAEKPAPAPEPEAEEEAEEEAKPAPKKAAKEVVREAKPEPKKAVKEVVQEAETDSAMDDILALLGGGK